MKHAADSFTYYRSGDPDAAAMIIRAATARPVRVLDVTFANRPAPVDVQERDVVAEPVRRTRGSFA